MWLHAKAGSGKTVLTSTIVNVLETTIDGDETGVVAYFYFSFQNKETQDLRALKTSLLVQIIRKLAYTRPHGSLVHIPAEFRKLRDKYFPSTTPKTEELDSALRNILNDSKNGFIVIDALDECDTLDIRLEVLTFLSGLVQTVKSNIRVLITSRADHDIVTAMAELGIPKYIHPFDTRSVDSDIRDHLGALLEKSPYARWSKDIQNEVIERIVSGANGVFRWADLQIQELAKFSRKPDIRRALDRLPKDLNQTYERMLSAIDDNYVGEAVSILRWLSYSKKQITLSQLAEVAAFRTNADIENHPVPYEKEFDVEFDTNYRFGDPSDILSILRGLVTVIDRKRHPDQWVRIIHACSPQLLQDKVVAFAHFSVEQYLRSRDVSPPHFQIKEKDSVWYIFKSSLAYISHYDDTTLRATPYPLLTVASYHIHLFVSQLHNCSKAEVSDVITLVECYLGDNRFAVRLALSYPILLAKVQTLPNAAATGDVELIKFFHASRAQDESPDGNTTLLLFTAIEGGPPYFPFATYSPLLSSIPAEKLIHDSITGDWMATLGYLTYSTDSTKLAAVDWLLNNVPINVNAVDETGETALLKAARLGLHDIVARLLSVEGIDVTVTDKRGWGLHTMAITLNYPIIFDIALRCDEIDLQLKDEYGWTPIEWSQYHKREHMTEVLLSEMHPRSGSTACSTSLPPFLTFTQRLELSPDIKMVLCLCFSHSGSNLAMGGDSKKALIYALISGSIIPLLGHNDAVESVSWSPDDSKIVTCSRDGFARLYRSNDGSLLWKLNKEQRIRSDSECACAWVNDQSFYIGSENRDTSLTLVTIDSTRVDNPIIHHIVLPNTIGFMRVKTLAISPDRNRLFVSRRWSGLTAFRTDNNSIEYVVELPGSPFSIDISPDSRCMLISYDDGTLGVHDAATAASIRILPGPPTGEWNCLFPQQGIFGGPTGSLPLKGNANGTITVWDKDTGRLMGIVDENEPTRRFGEHYTVSWRPGDRYTFASGVADGKIRIWSCEDPRLDGEVSSQADPSSCSSSCTSTSLNSDVKG
ncbi:WD40-repeat-containing domain protein [Xylariaceae sp. FL1272]|nr:WD40-repeat-containing domain protein [Xylariaceae sp. FL1272]